MNKENFLRILILSTVVSISILYNAFAKCGEESRVTIDSLRCNEDAGGGWYQIDVNRMCGTRSGIEEDALELVEKRPSFLQYQKRIFISQLPGLLYEHKNEKEFQLFRQPAGKNGTIESFAIVTSDGKIIEKIKLHIKTNSGNECVKTIDVSGIWDKK